MPRTSHKKRLLNPLKSQLLFKEAPINGPKHEYGAQLRSAIHPRSFISEKQQRGDAPWVSPQFNSHATTRVSRGGRGKRNHQVATRITNKASALCLPQTRKASVSRFTPLSFQATTIQGLENLRHPQTKKNTFVSSDKHQKELQETPRRSKCARKCTEKRMLTRVKSATSKYTEVSKSLTFHNNGKGLTNALIQTPNTSLVPDPPHVETPEVPNCSSISPSNVQQLIFPPSQAKTPPRAENTSVLVEDTPEKDYGLRVTWRRRKGLMKLLIDKGQLLLKDAEVANEWI
ncbi:RAD9, HUS1, RAD1-interacting nuclear orphan protein 1 [Danio rerio]|uniref:RAD9, HUS1, RAD1-interacting nuclear orphan protein 1 n=1 Tax=Danio rerio TaxID=7955 RepID=E7F2N1_DANRE|nr:RAD9, HUS1, RAD1-interacting nuclear orphan protein 1 [Danio rerio]|eukprot:NP_001314963.1 RAD9, HUS1, RAD1-interacting nuclear orphan protein 1 [Danio rerio]